MLTVAAPTGPLPALPITDNRRVPGAPALESPQRIARALHLNPRIERYFLRYKENPQYQPVILAIESAIMQHSDLATLHRTAIDAARRQLQQEVGRAPVRGELLERAYTSAAAAVIARPYHLPGVAQLDHYFVSAALSSRAYKKLSPVPMPETWRVASAVRMAVSLGFFKELLDIPTSGFDWSDLRTDKQGARSAFQWA